MFKKTTEYSIKKEYFWATVSALFAVLALLTASTFMSEESMADTDKVILAEGKIGENATYTLWTDGSLDITGEGELFASIPRYDPYPISTFWMGNNDRIQTVQFDEGITTVGGYLFAGCTNLKEIAFPSTLIRLGNGSFYGCTSLESVTLPDNLTGLGTDCFNGCTALETVCIPASVISINGNVFAGCTNLTSIDVSDDNGTYSQVNGMLTNKSRTSILSCPAGLTEVTVPYTVRTIASDTFKGCILLTDIIVNGVGTIADNLFSECTSLKTVTLTATTIGNEAFKGCVDLSEITMSRATTIGVNAFNGCKNLESCTMPSVKNIKDYAFYGCRGLTSIILPSTLENIGLCAFQNCDRLVEVGNGSDLELKAGNISYGYVAHYALRIYDPASENSGIKEYTDGNGIAYKFIMNKDTYQLICGTVVEGSIHLPENVILDGSNIGRYDVNGSAYSGLNGLIEVYVPSVARNLEDGSFSGCHNLVSATILNTGNIGYRAFEDCPSLSTLTIGTPEYVDKGAFPGIAFKDAEGTPVSISSDDLAEHTYLINEGVAKEVPVGYVSVEKNGDMYTVTTDTVAKFNSRTLRNIVNDASKNPAVQLTVRFGDVTLVFDNTALKGLKTGSNTLSLTTTAYNDLTEVEKTLVSGKVYTIGFGYNLVFEGNVTVTLPFTYDKSDKDDRSVVVEMLDGTAREYIACTESVGYITFTTDRPSTYGGFVCHEHVFGSKVFENVVESTCTEQGHYDSVYYCLRCGHDISRITIYTPALGHAAIVDSAVEPTCTETGLTEGSHCERCGDIIVEQTVVPALGHDYVATVIEEPTCTKEGSVLYVCTRDESHTYTETLAKEAHVAVIVPGAAPTCTETGLTEGKRCSVCGTTLIEQTVVPALGHDLVHHDAKEPTESENGWYAYDTCTRCDYTTYKEWVYEKPADDNTMMYVIIAIVVIVLLVLIAVFAIRKRQ
ncbi:MAG: leucine-rich repeat domain-containing protein [archaeon]|nr:leucine-rich repeat domain-containing protein [archaeon]